MINPKAGEILPFLLWRLLMGKVSICIGLGFGDEGKGKVVSHICHEKEGSFRKPLVVRFSGGQQAGHSVYYKGKHHMFSNYGSGTLQGCPTFFSKYCTIEPVGIMNEHREIERKICDKSIRLMISKDCPVTTPYDIQYNNISGRYNIDGSCYVGVGQTWQRESEFYSLKASDLKNKKVLDIKMKMIKKYYDIKAMDGGYARLDDSRLNTFYEAIDFINNNNLIGIIGNNINTDGDIIFEGSQGVLLDQNHGFFPHVTRSKTDLTNAMKIIEESNFSLTDIHLVTRAYQTRHGNGPMTNDDYVGIKFSNIYELNESDSRRGRFRTSILDLDLIQYSVDRIFSGYEYLRDNRDIKVNLIVTCVDSAEMSHPNSYMYTREGELFNCKNRNQFISEINRVVGANNVYISLSPFAEELSEVRIN